MSGAKRNPDRLNTIGVIVVGICGAVLVYVTIVALEAFYVNDTSEIQTMADYGGQDTNAKSLRTDQVNRIGEYGTNPKPAAPKANEPERQQSYRIPIDLAMKLVVEGARSDPAALVPAVGRSEKATVLPIFGRPKLIPAQPPTGPFAPAPGATPAGAVPAPGAGSDAGSGAGSARDLPAAPMVPTGAGTGPAPVGGAGSLDKPAAPAPPVPPAATPPAATPPAATPPGTAAPGTTPPRPNPAGSAAPKGNGK
jgi:hypothetical protein